MKQVLEKLVRHYGFETGGYSAEELVSRWLKDYEAGWVRLAVIEALYQGRYKTISIEQILHFWSRRGRPTFHFNHDFERLICGKTPQDFAKLPDFSHPSPENNNGSVSTNEVAVDSAPLTFPDWDYSAQQASRSENSQLRDDSSNAMESNQALEEDSNLQPLLEIKRHSHVFEDNGLQSEVEHSPIHQFTPAPGGSEFYLKLKAVAKQDANTSE